MNLDDAKTSASANWGQFRKWIAANPLTGFWVGVGVGFIGGGLVRAIF